MKQVIYFIILSLLGIQFTSGQNIQLLVSPKPSPYISDWTSKRETAQIIISNLSGNNIEAKVKTQLFLNGITLYAETKTSAMPIISISPGVSTFGSDEIYPASAIQFQGTNMNSVLQTGKISDGTYTLCVQLLNPNTGLPLNAQPPVCKVFTIVSYQAPILLWPANNATMTENAARNTLFKWTAMTPNPNEPISYRLKIFEVITGQADIQAVRNNLPIVEKDLVNQTQSIWPPEFMPPENGKNYVWTVVPIDPIGRNYIDGDGFAQPFVFKVKPPQMLGMTNPGNPPDSTQQNMAAGDTISAGQNGEFKIVVSQVTKASNGNLTGKGKVWIPWIKTHFLVSFENIKVDSSRTLVKGGIIVEKNASISNNTSTYPQAWAQSLIAGNSWINNMIDGATTYTNNQINTISNWVDNSSGMPPLNYEANISPPVIPGNGLKLPLGLVFSGGNHKFLITEILFKPNESKLNFLVQTEWMDNGVVKKLGFKGCGFLFRPSKVLFNNGRIELVENINFTNSNQKIEYTFKKGTSNSGCFIHWSDTGIVNTNIELEAQFTREWLIPIPSGNATQRTKATLIGNGRSLQDIILTGSLGACEFVKVKGFKLKQATNIVLDFSDSRNTGNIQFPQNYPGDTGVDWRGFYIPTASLTIPEAWSKNNQPIPVSLNHFIIDNVGLSVKAKATQVVNLSQGAITQMTASLDTLELSIVNNSLQYGKAKGFLIIPICNDSNINRMKYTATLNQNNADSGLEFVLVPSNPIYTELFKGQMTLHPSSSLKVGFKQDIISVQMKLDGTFKWNNPNLMAAQNQIINGLPAAIKNTGIKGLKMELDFEKLSLDYTDNLATNTLSTTFNIGTWSFASPQKLAFNLPISLEQIKFQNMAVQQAGANQKELFRGAITMKLVANLTDNIGGATKFGIAFALQKNTQTKKFKAEYKCAFVDSIYVNVDVAAVKMNGYLKIYDNEPIYGDGFKSMLQVKFNPVSVSANALVQFGNTAYQNSNTLYRYWRVEANATFGQGIPFISGLGFYGFGGGAYENMNPVNAVVNGKNTIVFQPKKGTTGFKVLATIGTYPKIETFNMDASILGTFAQGNGLVKLGFTGNFYVGASVAKRATAKIKGNVNVDYDFTAKIFNLLADVTVNAPPIKTPAPAALSLFINAKENKWYFYFGRPSQTNTVKIYNFSLYEYLIFGNYLTDLPNGFTNTFKTDYYSKIGSYPTYSGALKGGVGSNTQTGKGMAMGVGIKFDDQIKLHIFNGTCRKWSVQSNLAAGAELNLAFLEYIGCTQYNPFGINGYRAEGSIAMYAKASAFVEGKSTSKTCDTKTYPIADFRTGIWLQGKFPNPSYLAGRIEGDVELFGNDNLTKRFNWDFKFGDDCAGTETVAGAGVDEDKASDYKNSLIQSVEPTKNMLFPINSPLNVKYSLEPNRVFDVGESKLDGTVKTRTFRMVVNTVKLEVKNNNNTFSNVSILSKKDLMGIYQYYVKPPINMQTQYGSATSNNNLANLSNLQNTGGGLNPPPFNSNGMLQVTQLTFPSVPITPNYPPVPAPPINHLENKKTYKFKVVATLQEYNSQNNSWETAKTKNGVAVTQTWVKTFSTPNPIAVSNQAPKTK